MPHRAERDGTTTLRRSLSNLDLDRDALILAALLVVTACAAAFRRARAFGRRPFLALPLIGAGVLTAFAAFDLPISFSAIVSVPLLLAVLSAGTLAGVLGYLCALRLLLGASKGRSEQAAFGFHCRSAALAYLGLAPVLWLAFGYSQREELAPPALMFLPLPAAFVGCMSAILLAAATVALAAKRRGAL